MKSSSTNFCAAPLWASCFLTSETARHYGRLFQFLGRQGPPIPTNDVWIAALALQHDLILDSADKHFLRVPNISLLRPTKN